MPTDLGDDEGKKGCNGIYVQGVNAASLGDADIQRFNIQEYQEGIHLVECDNVRSYVSLFEKGGKNDGATATRLTGCTASCGNYQHTIITEAGHEGGVASFQDAASGVTRGDMANSILFIKAGTNYPTESRFITKQSTPQNSFNDYPDSLSPKSTANLSIGLFRNNNYFDESGTATDSDFDVFDEDNSGTNPNWGQNLSFSGWSSLFPYSGTVTENNFSADELNVDPMFVSVSGRDYRTQNPVLESSGVAWMQPSDVIVDAFGNTLSNTVPPVGYAVNLNPALPTLTTPYTTKSNDIRESVSEDLRTNWSGAVNYAVTGLPEGLTSSNGVVTGTAEYAQESEVRVVGSNAVGSVVSNKFKWTIGNEVERNGYGGSST